MVSTKVTIVNPTGLHARPASELAAFAKTFESKIFLINGPKQANAASVIKILTLGAKQGVEIEVTAEGPDEAEAAEAVAKFIGAIEE
ncbi:MAG: HPr family phosphocarrier protein [Bacillota bacterium]